MLSGIGRGADLQALGIPVVRDAQGVGQNLQDHVTATLIWRTPRADADRSRWRAPIRRRPCASIRATSATPTTCTR